MQCTIKINMDNAAFRDCPSVELARILRECSDMAESGYTCFPLSDINGNTIGLFDIKQ